MKDILIGLVIVVCCFLIADFIYSENNTCSVENAGYTEAKKCGILKDKAGIEIDLFGRYW